MTKAAANSNYEQQMFQATDLWRARLRFWFFLNVVALLSWELEWDLQTLVDKIGACDLCAMGLLRA